MSKRHLPAPPPPSAPVVRCAVYTRKSTAEGLDQAFNALDAQRAAAEAYIASQRAEGWSCLPQRYDDGGCTGAHTDRPALQRLLDAIHAGQIDAVVVYKVDRLSRSLFDFATLMATFEQHQVAFVSVTQQFNTATSMGRLVLNVLLSFAQFERELIAERTRDKMAATRRQGRWCGGRPVLGYDIDPRGSQLVVNRAEAARVRAIFALYRKHRALAPVVRELARRGWRQKRWRTRAGVMCGGQAFTQVSLARLLRNVAYHGQVRSYDAIHAAAHPGLVDGRVWQRVQALLARRGRHGRQSGCPRAGAVLQGRLRCLPCGCAMVPTYTTRPGHKRYRYYVCSGAQKRGWHTCPSKALPAAAIEQAVREQIGSLSRDAALLRQALAPARPEDGSGPPPQVGSEAELRAVVAAFAAGWAALPPEEQTRLLPRLAARVDYDGAAGRLSVTVHPPALQALAQEWARHSPEALP
jgi:site-specific DNA recombinase